MSGKRERYFLETKAEAEIYAESQRIRLENFGTRGASTLSPAQQEQAANASLFCNHIKFLSTRLCEIGSRARRRLKRPFPTRPRWMSSLNIDNAAKVTPAAYGKRGIGSISCTKSCSTRSLRRISPARWMERVRPFGISRFASWADCSTSGSNEDSAWTIPFVGLTFSQRDPFEIQLYTVGEIAAIMAAVEKNAPGLVPFLAVSFFCGIRRAEAMRLEWPAIEFYQIAGCDH